MTYRIFFAILLALLFVGVGKANAAELDAKQKAGDSRDDNGLKLKLLYCPPGKFLMGTLIGAIRNARGMTGGVNRKIEVTLTHGFWLGQTEVTQSQWKQVMETEPWTTESSLAAGDNYPATRVSWIDAVAFCERLTTQERKAGRLAKTEMYRLPTEAEWEYACRAGTETEFCCGDTDEKLGDYAWFEANSAELIPTGGLAEVAKKKANSWGFFDMHGNAIELCADWYVVNPVGGEDPAGPAHGTEKVFRGGAVGFDSRSCRSAWRISVSEIGKHRVLGFRVVCASVAD